MALEKAWYLGDEEDGVYFTVKTDPTGKFYVKAVTESSTASMTRPLPVAGVYGTKAEAVKAGVEAAIAWCKEWGLCCNAEEAEKILGLF